MVPCVNVGETGRGFSGTNWEKREWTQRMVNVKWMQGVGPDTGMRQEAKGKRERIEMESATRNPWIESERTIARSRASEAQKAQ